MNNLVFSLVIVYVLYYSSIIWIVWHWKILKKMAYEDYLVRGGIMVLMLNVASATLASLYGFDSIWRRPINAVAACAIATGLTVLIWKHRRNLGEGALQVYLKVERKPITLVFDNPTQEETMTTPIVSTKQLIPDGVAGYAKAIAAFVTMLVEAITPFIELDVDTARIVHIVVAVLGVLAVYGIPNAVKPTPPAPVLPAEEV